MQSSEFGASEEHAHASEGFFVHWVPIFSVRTQPFTHDLLHPKRGCPTKMVKRDSQQRWLLSCPKEIALWNTDWNWQKGKKTASRCIWTPALAREIMNLIRGLKADTYSSFEVDRSPFQRLPDTWIRSQGGFGWQRKRQGPHPYSWLFLFILNILCHYKTSAGNPLPDWRS